MPNFKDKIIFLESLSGEVAKMVTFLNQYKQMGIFNDVKGIILGTFTSMEKNSITPTIEEIVKKVVDNENLPIAKTCEVGHGNNSKGLIIGGNILLEG